MPAGRPPQADRRLEGLAAPYAPATERLLQTREALRAPRGRGDRPKGGVPPLTAMLAPKLWSRWHLVRPRHGSFAAKAPERPLEPFVSPAPRDGAHGREGAPPPLLWPRRSPAPAR